MKPKSRNLLFSLGTALITISHAHAADGTWAGDAAGNWSDTSKWASTTVADGAGSSAFFTANITAARTVTLDSARTIGNITFTDSTTSSHDLTISGANVLTLDVTTGSPLIDVTQSGRTLNISSQISGSDGLKKAGLGILALSGANDYTGATTIQGGNIFTGAGTTTNVAGGSITLSGASGTITATTALNLSNGGTLRMISLNAENSVDRINSADIAVAGGGSIAWDNTAGANSFAETVGNLTLNSGQLNVSLGTNQTLAGTQTLTLGTFTRSGTTSAVTYSAAGTGPQASGNQNMIVVTSAGSTTPSEIIGSWATTGTTAALQTDYGFYNSDFVVPANIAASAQTAWSTDNTTGTGTLNNTSSALFSATLGVTRNINSLRSTNTAASAVASNANITITGHALAVGDVVTFSATTMPTGLTAGTPYYVVSAVAGTSVQVSATSGGAVITPTGASTAMFANSGIQVASGKNLGTTGILNGTATRLNIVQSGAAGTVTLPTTTAGSLYVTTGSGAIAINAPLVNNTGALTLVKSGSGGSLTTNNITTSGVLQLNGVNTYNGDTIINAGTLMIGNNANAASLGSGSYAGKIVINAGAMLHIASTAAQTLSGEISGEGALMKTTGGTLILSGNNTYTGKTSIAPITTTGAGVLTVSSFNSIVSGSMVVAGPSTVSTPVASSSLGAPTTVANGTIDLGGPLSIQGPATLRYTGAGETTDRVVNIQFGANTTRTIETNGTGLLKFTSTFTISNTAQPSQTILTGTGNGEIVGGLPSTPAAWTLTKSGNGTWTLGGAVGNTGILTVNAGTLALQKKSSLMNGTTANWTAALINVKSAATLALNVDSGDVNGLSSTSLDTLLTNISVAGSATAGLQSGAILALDTSTATGGTFTQGNIIANSTGANGGTIGLTKRGTGTLILDKANTYTGLTTVAAGTLTLTANRTVVPSVNPGLDIGSLGSPSATLNLQADLALGTAQFRVGANGPGTVFQTTGALTWTGGSQLTVGITGGMAGIYNLSGGSINTVFIANRGLILGVNASTNGTFNLSGTGTLTMAPTSVMHIGRSENAAATGASGTFNQTGGTATAGELRMGGNTAGNNASQTALLDLSGGIFTAASFTALSGGDGSVSTINISGTADVTLPEFPQTGLGGSGATAVITFNGGTLKNSAASSNYLGVITSAKIKVGGAKFETTGGSITLLQALQEDAGSTGGGLTKQGGNTLTLSGTNTYTGATTITDGTLALGATDVLANTSAVSIGTATFDAATFTDTVGTLDTTGAAVINLGSGGALAFANSAAVDWTGGTLNITGTYTPTSIRIGTTSSGLTSGQLAVISVNGSGAGTYSLDSNGYLVAGGPGPVDHFDISSISSPQTVGTAITGITLTAKDSSNNTVTGFTGTVTFGGTGGFTGTSGSFVLGVLSSVSVIPSNAGSNLTLTVDDGASHTGTTTIATIQTQYEAWAGGAAFDADTNGDGVKNGLAFLLGAANPSENALTKLPTVTESGGNLTLTFSSRNAAKRGGAVLTLQQSSDLGISDAWLNAAVPETSGGPVNGVTFTVTPGDPLNSVSATISSSEAAAGKLFGRVEAEQP